MAGRQAGSSPASLEQKNEQREPSKTDRRGRNEPAAPKRTLNDTRPPQKGDAFTVRVEITAL